MLNIFLRKLLWFIYNIIIIKINCAICIKINIRINTINLILLINIVHKCNSRLLQKNIIYFSGFYVSSKQLFENESIEK